MQRRRRHPGEPCLRNGTFSVAASVYQNFNGVGTGTFTNEPGGTVAESAGGVDNYLTMTNHGNWTLAAGSSILNRSQGASGGTFTNASDGSITNRGSIVNQWIFNNNGTINDCGGGTYSGSLTGNEIGSSC